MPETLSTWLGRSVVSKLKSNSWGRVLSTWMPFALIFCSLLSTARAESVVMLPSPKDSVTTEAKIKAAQAGVLEGLASQNYHLRSDDVIEQKLLVRPDLRCDVREKSCAKALMAETTADLGCSVLVWRGSPKSVPSRVTVFLVEKDGTHHFADAEVGTQDLAAAAKQASVAAVAARQGNAKAPLPPSPEVVAKSTSSKVTATHTERPVIGPVILGSAGLILAGVATYAFMASGCDREVGGVCQEGKETTAWAPVYAVAGGGAIVGAVLWYALGGKTVTNKPLRADLGPSYIGVSGNF